MSPFFLFVEQGQGASSVGSLRFSGKRHHSTPRFPHPESFFAQASFDASCDLPCLASLSLSHNQVTSLASFGSFGALLELNLNFNAVANLDGLVAPSLSKLFLSSNRLSLLRDINLSPSLFRIEKPCELILRPCRARLNKHIYRSYGVARVNAQGSMMRVSCACRVASQSFKCSASSATTCTTCARRWCPSVSSSS